MSTVNDHNPVAREAERGCEEAKIEDEREGKGLREKAGGRRKEIEDLTLQYFKDI